MTAMLTNLIQVAVLALAPLAAPVLAQTPETGAQAPGSEAAVPAGAQVAPAGQAETSGLLDPAGQVGQHLYPKADEIRDGTFWMPVAASELAKEVDATFNFIMTGTDVFACEGTSAGVHQDGAWRAGVTHAGRWCDVFEVRDFLIQRCFIYLDPDYAGLDTARYPWLSADGRDPSKPMG